MTTQSKPEMLHFTWGEALTNYNLNSAVLHTISKTPSTTNQEFEIKYTVTEEMKNARHRYGRGLQLATLGGLIVFCMKSNMVKTKVFAGFMYTYWIAHFYTLGAHLGLYVNTKWAADQLTMDPRQYATGKMMQEFIRMSRERNENKAKGLPYLSESDFIKEFHLMGASQETKESYDTSSYVANDYFQKNFAKYAKTDPSDNDPNKVFNAQSNDYDDELKIPLIDCFFTRYVVHNTGRWLGRLGNLVGVSRS